MQNTVLILGPTGRMGRHAAAAFERNGWEVRRYNRKTDTLWDAAWGASVIVNCWNPPYAEWADQLPSQTADLIEVAKASGATVILPGNVYVYGADAPEVFGPDTPHAAQNPLGRVRVEMEATYRASGVQTIVVRAGDYIDTQASGNWFDMVIAKNVRRGTITYPAPLDRPHAFTFLPDVAATMVALANKRGQLDTFEDVNVPSHTLTGEALATALADVLGQPVKAKQMNWWPIRLAGLVWPMGRHLAEMRYLWAKPHTLATERHAALCPEVPMTSLDAMLRAALNTDVDPDEAMWASGQTIAAE